MESGQIMVSKRKREERVKEIEANINDQFWPF
jgi:hypothetical protein